MADLCTLAQVKDRARIFDNAADALIASLIPVATKRLNVACGREFAPQVTATRRFDLDSYLVQLTGSDLRTVTTVTLHPESLTEAVVLVAGTDYELDVERLTGTAGMIRLSGHLGLWSTRAANFGHAQIEVAGGWGIWAGYATAAVDINEAAVECVLAWVDKPPADVMGYSPGDVGRSQPMFASTWDIPSPAWRKIQPYSRNLGCY